MNGKATISKELNAKHIKVLEGLLRLPENKECADCRTKAPRWASVNIGIFVCLHCSGIHRSLGVHISKVRSVTLDTWLPEQVAFLQSMGNDKSNVYWEAELPPTYGRGGIENFIRAKYVEKRWVPKDSTIKAPLRSKEELASPGSSRPGTGDGIGECASNRPLCKEKKELLASEKETAKLFGGGSPGAGKGLGGIVPNQQHQDLKEKHQPSMDLNASDLKRHNQASLTELAQVAPSPTPNHSSQKSPVSKVESSASNPMPVGPFPEVDYATELFRMLCMDDSTENDSSSSDTNAWVHFESDEVSTKETKAEPKSGSKIHPEPKVDHVQKASEPLTNGYTHEHQRDSTNCQQSLSRKGSTSSAGPVHLQRLPMPNQNGASSAVVTGLSNGRSPIYPATVHRQTANGFRQPSLNGGSLNRIMGTQIPVIETPNNMQNGGAGKVGVNSVLSAMPGSYRPTIPMSSISIGAAKRPPTALPVSGNDYDFSFLTQGLFSK